MHQFIRFLPLLTALCIKALCGQLYSLHVWAFKTWVSYGVIKVSEANILNQHEIWFCSSSYQALEISAVSIQGAYSQFSDSQSKSPLCVMSPTVTPIVVWFTMMMDGPHSECSVVRSLRVELLGHGAQKTHEKMCTKNDIYIYIYLHLICNCKGVNWMSIYWKFFICFPPETRHCDLNSLIIINVNNSVT